MTDFDTTLGVIPDAYSYSHPMFFQNPEMDLKMLADPMIAQHTDPVDMWQTCKNRQTAALSKLQFNDMDQWSIAPDPADPPLSKQERKAYIEKLNPVIDKTLINVQPTLLFYVFFSRENISTLQKNLRYSVNKWSGYHIGNQSVEELVILMENVYSSYARNIDEQRAPSKVLLKFIKTEIGRLNELVVSQAVPIIIDKIEQHVAYLKAVETPRSAASLARPINTNITGTTVYRTPSELYS